MITWWASLSVLSKILWGVTLTATLVFIIQSILTFIGADVDSNADFDMDASDLGGDLGGGINLYTFRNFVNFILGFGWTAILLKDSVQSKALLIIIATLVGIALVAIVMYLFRLLAKMQASGNIDVVSNIDTESVPPLDLSVRRDHTAALAATPQYRLLEKNVESHQLMHNMKKGENLPTVGVGAAYSYNDFMDKGRGVGTLFATVSVPISGWWGGTHAVRKQRLALDDAKSQLQDNSEKLIINMNNAWANVETSHKQLQIARKSIEQSEENLRLNNDFYKAGTTKLSDLLDAQSSYQQARDKFVDAYINYQTNLLKYRQATGQ